MGVSLFVENIPSRMHWTGLWHMFARHGEVYGTFIARRLSRGGKRFGFVRFRDEVDVNSAMERLHGFMVYGYRLSVKPANHTGRRNQRWQEQFNDVGRSLDDINLVSRNDREAVTGSRVKEKRKIRRHVVDEDHWKLQRCLVGEMANVCSVHSITL
ncbi:hypothetical protein V6N13_015983 [Hibiscus sabdariffa]